MNRKRSPTLKTLTRSAEAGWNAVIGTTVRASDRLVFVRPAGTATGAHSLARSVPTPDGGLNKRKPYQGIV